MSLICHRANVSTCVIRTSWNRTLPSRNSCISFISNSNSSSSLTDPVLQHHHRPNFPAPKMKPPSQVRMRNAATSRVVPQPKPPSGKALSCASTRMVRARRRPHLKRREVPPVVRTSSAATSLRWVPGCHHRLRPRKYQVPVRTYAHHPCRSKRAKKVLRV